MEFPLFRNPEQYLQKRDGNYAIKTYLKRKFEYWAIDDCLKHTNGIKSVCDIPCGPGRLFKHWHSKRWQITGMDLSHEMLKAANSVHETMNLKGTIKHHNAFESHDPVADIVASVRFIYYFEKERRIELLKALAKLSNRYLLIQYKSNETRKGKANARKPLNSNSAYRKYHCSHTDIADEIRLAGLKMLGIQTISNTSDRVFAIAEI